MRVIVLGLRGIPDVQGGVETHAQHLYPRLAALGCDVEVIVRTPFVERGRRRYGAIALTRIWAPRLAGVEAFVHSVLAVLYAGARRPDIVHIHAIGPAITVPLARLLGLKVVVTHHGPDYDREKCGVLSRYVLRIGERVGMRHSHARIAISKVISDLIKRRYGRDSEIIPNGVPAVSPSSKTDAVVALGLVPGGYFLNVGRLVPEKRQLDLIAAYRAISPCKWQLALVGALGSDAYARAVASAASVPGVVLAGFKQGEALREIYSHAGAFVLPSSHEGLPIVLLEAMSLGLPVLASDIPANLEVGLEEGSYFPLGDVAELGRRMGRQVETSVDNAQRARWREFVARKYDWDQIAAQTLRVYASVLSRLADDQMDRRTR